MASTRSRTRGSACRRRRASPWGRSATTSASRPRTAATSTTTRVRAAMQCNWDGNYDGTPTEPNGWLQGFPNQPEGYPRGSRYPRVVNLFVIPYQSLKGSTGGDPRETVPDPHLRVVLRLQLDGAEQPAERPVPGPRLRPRPELQHGPDSGPRPAERRHHGRLRRDGRLRVRPGGRDRGLCRGPTRAVPCFTRPMSLPI